jgi:hypothetical protein
MNTGRQFFNFSEFQNTGNKAIDLVAACVGHYRQFKKPLKVIYLKPNLFDLFKAGTEVLMKREIQEDELLQFDGVYIEKGSSLMVGRDLYVDFWEPEKALN